MTLFEQLVEESSPRNEQERVNHQRELMQKVTLAGFTRGGFFEKAAFYGGTCLRLMYGLPRYSEDMDFSLLDKDSTTHLEDYFSSIINEFALLGLSVEVDKKDKKQFGRVESAFLKENTEAYEIKFQTRRTLKVKIELDTDPPLKFQTEQKIIRQPYGFPVRCMTLPDLFAGKMHALVYRAWGSRIKGRDWYDFEWYVNHNVPLDFRHLQERVREFSGATITKEEFLGLLRERLSSANINQVKADVLPFVDNTRDLDFWSNEYFLSLMDHLILQ